MFSRRDLKIILARKEKQIRMLRKRYNSLMNLKKEERPINLNIRDKIVKTNEEERFKKIINKFKIYPPKTIEDRIYNNTLNGIIEELKRNISNDKEIV